MFSTRSNTRPPSHGRPAPRARRTYVLVALAAVAATLTAAAATPLVRSHWRPGIGRPDQYPNAPYFSAPPARQVPPAGEAQYYPSAHASPPPEFRLVDARSAQPVAADSASRPVPEQIPLAGGSPDIELTGTPGRVSIVARDAPLQSLLSMLARKERLNIVAATDVAANVTITLDNVALEDALTAILSVAGYTWTQQNNIIYVTSYAGASRLSPETQGRRVRVFQLSYVSAEDVATIVQGLLSPVGKVFVNSIVSTDNRRAQEVVVVEDLPGYMARVAEYIAQIDIPPRQVLIEAHILEVELSADQKHGIDYDYLARIGNSSLRLETKGFADLAARPAFFATVKGTDLTAVLEAIRNTTNAKTLASPRVLALNGQEARIQVGEQLGFKVTTTTETATLESVNFLDTGVVLRVVPRISCDGQVLMHVKPEISSGEISPETQLPEEDTTQVETDVLLPNGTGVVVGGLIREKNTSIQNKIPFLGDIWLGGLLFQRRNDAKERVEIVIALIPRIVPFDPSYAQFNRTQFDRAQTPLLYAPLKPAPRPWEPQPWDALGPTLWQVHRLPPVYPGSYIQPDVPPMWGEGPLEPVEMEYLPVGPRPAMPAVGEPVATPPPLETISRLPAVIRAGHPPAQVIPVQYSPAIDFVRHAGAARWR